MPNLTLAPVLSGDAEEAEALMLATPNGAGEAGMKGGASLPLLRSAVLGLRFSLPDSQVLLRLSLLDEPKAGDVASC